jgi:hypothetical protein
VRRQREGETLLKRGTAALFYRLMQHAGHANLPLDAGDFRLMTRRVLDILNSMPEQPSFHSRHGELDRASPIANPI